MRAPHRLALLVMAALSGAPRARADDAGGTAEVRLSHRPRVLEASIPRGSAYEKALDAIRAHHYRRAEELFAASESEFNRSAGEGRLLPARARTLMLKAHFESMQAARLVVAEKEGNQRRVTADLRLVEATALHNLYLTASAFLGRSDEGLFDRAARAYQTVLGPDGLERSPRARIGYAGLLASAGQRRAAAAEFSRVDLGEHLGDAIEYQVHYYAASGDADRAFRLLRTVRDTLPDWPEVRVFFRCNNDLDALRDDPRFVQILGAEE